MPNNQDSSAVDASSTPDLNDLLKALARKPPDKKNAQLRLIKKASRWIPCSISPFIDIDKALKIGMYAEGVLKTSKDGTEYPDPGIDLEPEYRSNLLKTYHLIFRKVPYLKDYVLLFENSPEDLEQLTHFIKANASSVRHEDTNSLRYSVFSYAGRNGNQTDFGGKSASKSIRGFNHPDSGRLNCPMRDVEEYDQSWERYRDLVKEGEKVIDEDDFPCNVYKEEEYDPENLESGLMKGDFVFNVCRHIYTGGRTPGLATDGPSKGKGGKGKINGQKEITPEMLAYAAVQARFSLSSENSWSVNFKDGNFDYSKYHQNILDLFEDSDDPWCIEILAWYTKRIFSSQPNPFLISRASRRNSDKERLKHQRAQRRLAGIAS